MAFSHSKLMGAPVPLVSGENESLMNLSVTVATKTRALPLQVRCEGEQNLQKLKTTGISRRDAMLYMTAEVLSGAALLSTEPAEARVGKLERRRQIMEKLEKLREEAGVPKPKTENGMARTPAPKRQLNPPQVSVRPIVEATLP